MSKATTTPTEEDIRAQLMAQVEDEEADEGNPPAEDEVLVLEEAADEADEEQADADEKDDEQGAEEAEEGEPEKGEPDKKADEPATETIVHNGEEIKLTADQKTKFAQIGFNNEYLKEQVKAELAETRRLNLDLQQKLEALSKPSEKPAEKPKREIPPNLTTEQFADLVLQEAEKIVDKRLAEVQGEHRAHVQQSAQKEQARESREVEAYMGANYPNFNKLAYDVGLRLRTDPALIGRVGLKGAVEQTYKRMVADLGLDDTKPSNKPANGKPAEKQKAKPTGNKPTAVKPKNFNAPAKWPKDLAAREKAIKAALLALPG